MDFRKFDGYYLVSVGDTDTAENHSSLNEALQLCRFQRKLCTAVQRIKNVYTNFLAKRLVLVNGPSTTGYTAYLKSGMYARKHIVIIMKGSVISSCT